MITNNDVACNGGAVGHDDMVANLAIVRHMGVRKHGAVITHGGAGACLSAAVNADKFTDSVPGANTCVGNGVGDMFLVLLLDANGG